MQPTDAAPRGTKIPIFFILQKYNNQLSQSTPENGVFTPHITAIGLIIFAALRNCDFKIGAQIFPILVMEMMGTMYSQVLNIVETTMNFGGAEPVNSMISTKFMNPEYTHMRQTEPGEEK